MDKPWELKISSQRSTDTLFVFHLFCEDSVCEPLYFKQFEKNIKVITHIGQKSMFKNLIKTIKKCEEDGYLKKIDTGYKLAHDGMEVWCVFDRDKGANGENIDEGNIEFDLVITTAMNQGINVAWSNDAFEMWILLHLMEIPIKDYERAKDRTYYYLKLKDYFQNHSSPNIDLQKALQYQFGYKHSLKSEQNFKNIVLVEIMPYISIAVERAKVLAQSCEVENDFSKKIPCTFVYKLVERILEEQTK
jgi:hypothetical protein